MDLLRKGGQTRRAAAVLKSLTLPVGPEAEAVITERLHSLATIYADLGLTQDAIATYTELVARGEKGITTDWQSAAALYNRSDLYLDVAEWDKAAADIEKSRELWEKIGHRNLASFTNLGRSNLLRRRGSLAEAAQAIDPVIEKLKQTGSWYLEQCYRERARVCRDCGDYSGALTNYRESLDIQLKTADWRNAATVLGEMAAIAASQADWAEARRRSSQAADLQSRLDSLQRFQYTPQQKAADEENEGGVRLLHGDTLDRGETDIRAREYFRSASSLRPDYFWYGVNAAFASARLRDWANAIDDMERAVRCAPKWWNTQLFNKRLDEYRSSFAAEVERRWASDPLSMKAKADYLAALEFVSQTAETDHKITGRLHGRLGLIAVLAGDQREAAKKWKEAAQEFAKGDDAPADAIASVWETMLRSTEDYWKAYDALAELSEQDADAVGPARRILANYLQRCLDAEGGSPPAPNIDRRLLRLEIGNDLVPEETSTDKWALFTTHIPEMRARVLASTGVKLPGIRVWQAGSGGDYIMYHDPLLPKDEEASVPLESRFSAAPVSTLIAAGVDQESLQPAVDPLTGEPGAWVTSAHWERLAEMGIPVWDDPFVFIIRHFESVIRRWLDTFVDLELSNGILDEWSKNPRLRDAVQRLRKSGGEVHMSRLLRAMVRDRIPITDGEAILGTIGTAELNPEMLPRILADLRMAYAKVLPGCDPRIPKLDCPEELERLCSELADTSRDGSGPVVSPQKLVSEVSEFLYSRDVLPIFEAAIVVSNAEIGSILRAAVARRLPLVSVISRAELWRADEVATAVDNTTSTSIGINP